MGNQATFLGVRPHCYICGAHTVALTDDHIPPESFFLKGDRRDLFEAPLCEPCHKPLSLDDDLMRFFLSLVDGASESALPGFSAAIRYGLAAPAGTPRPIIEKLSKELRAAVSSEEMRERLTREGAEPIASTPEEYAAEIDAEETKWSAIVKSLNLKIE